MDKRKKGRHKEEKHKSTKTNIHISSEYISASGEKHNARSARSTSQTEDFAAPNNVT
jgi:hypothetical protein